MKTSIITEKIEKPLLNQEQTALFVRALDLACLSLNPYAFVLLFKQFPLDGFDNTESFISQAFDILSFGTSHPLGVKVRNITPFETRCVACIFGKKVFAYKVSYLRHDDSETQVKIIYERSFAMSVVIEQGKLMDFGWCNFFLNEKEL